MSVGFNKLDLNAKTYYNLLYKMYTDPYSEYYPEQVNVLGKLVEVLKSGKYTCAIDYNLKEQCIIVYIRGIKYKLYPLDVLSHDGAIPKDTPIVWTKKVEELVYTLLLMVDVYRGFGDKYTREDGLTMLRYFTDVFPDFCTNYEPGFFLNEGFSEDCLVDLVNWCKAKKLILYATTKYDKRQFSELYNELKYMPRDKIGIRSEKELLRDVLEMLLDDYSDVEYFNKDIKLLYNDIKLREAGKTLKEFINNNNVLSR